MENLNSKKFLFITIAQFIAILITMGISIFAITINSTNINKEIAKYHYLDVYRGDIELQYEGSKCNVVDAIENYIDSVAPTSAVSGRILFEKCEEYNIDVRFALAQAQLESRFGTTGVASKTNSIFNVLAYDGRSAKDMLKRGHGYKHPDDSIEPYLKLLNESYIVGDKTEYDLLTKFVNKDGKRYASNTNYENMLADIFNKICNDTNITSLYKHYYKYKTILEK